jgi:hypothetical protein
MLDDDVARANALYEGCGRDLLNQPGRLTTASIAAEVAMMIGPEKDPADEWDRGEQ